VNPPEEAMAIAEKILANVFQTIHRVIHWRGEMGSVA
jgi:hypothetical protein